MSNLPMENMLFKREDYRNLSFPVHKVPFDQDLRKALPELTIIPEFANCERSDADNVIRYIVLMYDKSSPLLKKFNDLQKRKETAAVMAGYDLIKDAASVQMLFEFGDLKPTEKPKRKKKSVENADEDEDDEPEMEVDETFLIMVVAFLKYQNNHTWSMFVSATATFHEFQQTLLSPTMFVRNDKDKINAIAVKSKLIEDSDKIAERIDRYYKTLFQEDRIVDFVKRKSSSPESIADD